VVFILLVFLFQVFLFFHNLYCFVFISVYVMLLLAVLVTIGPSAFNKFGLVFGLVPVAKSHVRCCISGGRFRQITDDKHLIVSRISSTTKTAMINKGVKKGVRNRPNLYDAQCWLLLEYFNHQTSSIS